MLKLSSMRVLTRNATEAEKLPRLKPLTLFCDHKETLKPGVDPGVVRLNPLSDTNARILTTLFLVIKGLVKQQ